MKLAEQTYKFTLLTPAMIGGAEGKSSPPEMRVASIRGQIRWWHRNAGLIPNCNTVWGNTEPTAMASKVSLSLEAQEPPSVCDETILPHKNDQGRRKALCGAQDFTITLRRLVGCSHNEWAAAQNATKLWLLLGGIGLRVNRAAGSIWPLENWTPQNEDELRELLIQLGYTNPVQLADPSLGNNAKDLRREASDTVMYPQYFGCAKHNQRKPSPLKMKVIQLGSSFRLLLTGLSSTDMIAARHALGSGKRLGRAQWHQL